MKIVVELFLKKMFSDLTIDIIYRLSIEMLYIF